MHQPDGVEATRARIRQLLDELPGEDLLLVERFVIWTHRQASGQGSGAEKPGSGAVSYLYPGVFVPAAALDKLVGIVSVGGDALADSEALYDDA